MAEQIGDLTIAAHRWNARLLRTQAFVAAMLPTGRRARGASVPPHPFHQLWMARPALSRAQAAGQDIRDGRSRPERLSGPAVPDRRSTTAGTSPRVRVSRTAICVICVICGQIAMALCALCASVSLWFSERGGLCGLGVLAVQEMGGRFFRIRSALGLGCWDVEDVAGVDARGREAVGTTQG